jgi:crotonobetainyl-CoA:carnitine CoA-transferase CaiB-like acyl-CoA transferase
MGDDSGAPAPDQLRPLGGLRVVELGTGIAAGYAGKLFVDAGARVVKVEPAGGDPLRHWSATGADTTRAPGPLFAHLAAGKHSERGAPGDRRTDRLLAVADLVIDTGGLDPEALRADRPEIVVVSITPFGRTGPLADRPATDFTVQAECGSIAGRGVPERPPVQAGGRTSEWAAGLYGAVAGLAAVFGVRGGADGTVIDASWMEAMTLCTNLFSDPMWSIMRSLMGIDPPGDPRSVETPSIYPTADGWIGFNTNGPQHAEAFLRLIERDDLIESGYVNASTRVGNRHEFDGWVRDWTTRLDTAEILTRAAALRVPTARVNDAATVLQEEQLVAREFFVPSADGRLRVPRPHYRIDGLRPPLPGPVPELGASIGGDDTGDTPFDGERVPAPPIVAPAGTTPGATRPLEGLKVLDITSWWAGPSNTQLLAALGAEVVHVESIAHPDPMRYAAAVAFLDRDRWWELSSFYICINTNKRGITLDLGTPQGVALAERLIGWADVVVENYTPRVMPKFGLGWERVHELNPRAVMVRQPAFGLDGPWAERLGFAQNMEQMCGMAFLTGHADQEPLVPRGPCDPLGGAHAAFATLVALAQRSLTDEGSLVEVALIEGALNVTAEPVVEHTATGRIMGRDGNRSAHAAPQGLYACAADGVGEDDEGEGVGRERWLAVSVATDEQWQSLTRVLGAAVLAADPELAERAGRHRDHDRIDEVIASWAADRTVGAAVEELLGAGVPAAALSDPRTIHRHPQHLARGYFEDTPHTVLGSLPVFGMPFRISGRDRWNDRAAPVMGEHNHEVLGGLLGLSDTELAELAAAGVIGDRPVGT